MRYVTDACDRACDGAPASGRARTVTRQQRGRPGQESWEKRPPANLEAKAVGAVARLSEWPENLEKTQGAQCEICLHVSHAALGRDCEFPLQKLVLCLLPYSGLRLASQSGMLSTLAMWKKARYVLGGDCSK